MKWGYRLNMMWKGNIKWKCYNEFDEYKRSKWKKKVLKWDIE